MTMNKKKIGRSHEKLKNSKKIQFSNKFSSTLGNSNLDRNSKSYLHKPRLHSTILSDLNKNILIMFELYVKWTVNE